MLVAVMKKTTALVMIAGAAAVLVAQQQKKQPNADLGFTDTPILPGLKWHVHDPDRPHPPVVPHPSKSTRHPDYPHITMLGINTPPGSTPAGAP